MNADAGCLGVHDAGGSLDFGARDSLAGALERSMDAFAQWEIEVCSLAVLMSKKGFRVVDESRRTLELLPPERYGALSYWAKWACGSAQLALASKIFTQAELDEVLGGATDDERPNAPRFCGGEAVRVRSEKARVRWRRPHLRTPGYIHGSEGIVVRVQGPFANPEELAFFSQGPKRTDAYLYTVRFSQRALWKHYAGGADDSIDVDVYEGWLEEAGGVAGGDDGCGGGGWIGRGSLLVPVPAVHTAHGGAHTHEPRSDTEQLAVDREAAHAAAADKDGAFAALHGATVELLVRKGVLSRDELRLQVEALDAMAYGQTMEGATLVAKAWLTLTLTRTLTLTLTLALALTLIRGGHTRRQGVARPSLQGAPAGRPRPGVRGHGRPSQ